MAQSEQTDLVTVITQDHRAVEGVFEGAGLVDKVRDGLSGRNT